MRDAQPPDVVELDLRGSLHALKRRRVVLALTTLVIFGAALAWTFVQQPRYESRARVLVRAEAEPSLFRVVAPVADPNRVVQTELLAFDSPELRADVRNRIGHAPRVSVRQIDVTDVVEVIASARSGRMAAAVANAYATAYVDRRRSDAVDSVVAAAQQLQDKLSELQRQIDASSGDAQKALIDQQSLFRQKLDQLEVDGALREGGARLISEGLVPRSPVAPDRLRTGLIALVFGLITGVGLALAIDYLDDSVHSLADAQRAAPGLDVVGVIPMFDRAPEGGVESVLAPTSAGAEAVRTLRTSLAFLGLERDVRVLQVTSADPGEGKSVMVANTGVALARVGHRVVLVDCDLRRPRLHQLFGVENDAGVTSVLKGEITPRAAIRPIDGVDGLAIVPAGPPVTDPAEVLSLSAMRGLVEALRRDGCTVLIDSPPVLPVADALITAPLADATLIVCRAGRSRAKRLHRCLDLLGQVRAAVAGIILNGVRGGDGYVGAYEYPVKRHPVPTSRGER